MPGASSILVLLPERQIVAAVVVNANDRNDVAQEVVNQLISRVDPSMPALTFDPTEGFTPYDAQTEYRGRWGGTVVIDEKLLHCTLTFETGGRVTVEFPQGAAGGLLPREATFKPLVNGDLLLGTFAATLPGRDVEQKPGGYVLLRLVRPGAGLEGTMIAYAAPEGLRHLYPFRVALRRVP
jgi:hypothetical protein